MRCSPNLLAAPSHNSCRLGALVCATALSLASCGSPNPRVLDSNEDKAPPTRAPSPELSEAEKIRHLITAVRNSPATFIQDGIERSGQAAATDIERRVMRVPAGISTARQFIDRIGAGRLRQNEPDTVRLPDGTTVPARDWLLAQLASVEGSPSVPASMESHVANATPVAAPPVRSVSILDALTLVERSGLTFVAPAGRTLSGKPRGKRKEYKAPEFADMLRKKWEFLGADIHDLDAFVQEIATDSFSNLEPYRVVTAQGEEVEFRAWLLEQIDAKRDELQAQVDQDPKEDRERNP